MAKGMAGSLKNRFPYFRKKINLIFEYLLKFIITKSKVARQIKISQEIIRG